MLTRSRSLLLTLLSAFLIAACGDSDPSGLGDGSGSGDVDLTGTWNLTDSDDITLPLVRNDYNACQTEAEAAGYESGFGQVSIPEYWMVFKPNRTVAQDAASRRRCVFVDEHGSLAYSDWSAETREEKDVGVCCRSGTDIQLFQGIIAFLHREVAQSLLATLTSPKRTNP